MNDQAYYEAIEVILTKLRRETSRKRYNPLMKQATEQFDLLLEKTRELKK